MNERERKLIALEMGVGFANRFNQL